MAGDQQHRQADVTLLELSQQLQAVDAGQANVADHNAGEVTINLRKSLLGTADADAGNVFQGQGLLATEQYVGIVFDDQNAQRLMHGGVSPGGWRLWAG